MSLTGMHSGRWKQWEEEAWWNLWEEEQGSAKNSRENSFPPALKESPVYEAGGLAGTAVPNENTVLCLVV